MTAAAKFPLSSNLGWVGELNLWGSPLPRLWGLFEQSWLPWTQDFTPTGLFYVTVLKLSRTHIPIMQYSLKTKCHLMLPDFWKRTWGNGKQPSSRTYQHLIPKHFSNARCSFFLQMAKLRHMYFDQGQRVAKYSDFVNSQRPNSSPVRTGCWCTEPCCPVAEQCWA